MEHPQPQTDTDNLLGRGQRSKNISRLKESLENERRNEDGQLPKARTQMSRRKRSRRKTKRLRIDSAGGSSNEEDGNFTETDVSSGETTDTDIELVPTNVEIADSLPTKTVPETGRGSGKRKRVQVTVEEMEDEDSPNRIASRNVSPSSSFIIEDGLTSSVKEKPLRNPIYYFYERVNNNALGAPGSPGDKHYRCYHGGRKTLTITKAMRCSLNGLIGNLKACSPVMHRFYTVLKDRKEGDIVTQEEIDIAAGKTPLGDEMATKFVSELEKKSESIKKAFEKQEERALGEWNQETFEQLLASYIVTCDQPFEEVERPEFRKLLQYVFRGSSLKVPGRHAIKRRIMALSEEGIVELRAKFAKLDGMFTLSLDMWTSPNNIAFIAMVLHFVNEYGKLEEILIDFRELVGEHSGANIAEAVWETLSFYGIQKKILAFMLDNASNNDTFVQAIEERCAEEGIIFNAQWARLRCMPHTIHLAALQLLESIGAISGPEGKKASSRPGNYQDSVSALNANDLNDLLASQDNIAEDIVDDDILTSVSKLRKIIRAIRSSPQRKRVWLSQVSQTLAEKGLAKDQKALMPILDVRTRWSSTHEMMNRALEYKKDIDDFTVRYKDLHPYELSQREWSAIELVTTWLYAFRQATTQMSSTKQPMLSTTHAIFRGLQDELKKAITTLPDNENPKVLSGLIKAHRKLSDYYHHFDQSPYYTWAALLDPRISYQGLLDDYEDDKDLIDHLNSSKQLLQEHYHDHYTGRFQYTSTPPAPSTSSTSSSGLTFDFTARYSRKNRQVIDELEAYFKLPAEDFKNCDPFEWWFRHRAQFPNLYYLATDILAIPGSAVSVERVFSSGRDTISLRRACLNADTIRGLMLAKYRLRALRSA